MLHALHSLYQSHALKHTAIQNDHACMNAHHRQIDCRSNNHGAIRHASTLSRATIPPAMYHLLLIYTEQESKQERTSLNLTRRYFEISPLNDMLRMISAIVEHLLLVYPKAHFCIEPALIIRTSNEAVTPALLFPYNGLLFMPQKNISQTTFQVPAIHVTTCRCRVQSCLHHSPAHSERINTCNTCNTCTDTSRHAQIHNDFC